MRRVGKSSDVWQKSGTELFKCDKGLFRIYSQLVLQRKPLGPALSQIKRVKEFRDFPFHRGVLLLEVPFKGESTVL